MRKIFAVIITALMTINIANAQFAFEPTSHFGLRGALNFNALALSSLGSQSTNSSNTGYAFGGFYEWHIKRNFYLQGELDYSLKGASSNVTLTNYSSGASYVETKNYSLDYINLPILFEYGFGQRQLILLYTGPEFGYLISQKEKLSIPGRDSTLNPGYRKTDIDWDLGADIRIVPHFGLDIRYSYGLSNLLQSGTSIIVQSQSSGTETTVTNAKLKNRTVQLALYFKF